MITDKELEAIHQIIKFVVIVVGSLLISDFLGWVIDRAKIFFTRFLGKRKL